MVDPTLALLVFAATAGVAGVLWWPRRGLLACLARMSELGERVLREDALKHLYMCEGDSRARLDVIRHECV